jgi:hypothetical protein
MTPNNADNPADKKSVRGAVQTPPFQNNGLILKD